MNIKNIQNPPILVKESFRIRVTHVNIKTTCRGKKVRKQASEKENLI